MKVKVLFSSTGLRGTYGGAAVSEALLSSHLESRANVTVLCEERRFDDAFAKNFGPIRVVTYRAWHPWLAWIFRFHSLNRNFAEADLFHLNGHWRFNNFFFIRLCSRHNVPYVLHPRGMFLVGHRKTLIKMLFNRLIGNPIARGAARIIALSEFEVRHFRPYPIERAAVEVVPNPIVEKETTVAKKKEPYFLFIGRIEKRKNLIFLVDAFSRYLKWGGDGALVLIGPAERGYDRDILAHVEMLGISERVILKGSVFGAEKEKVIAAARAVIYPSLEEPFGRVPFEAIGLGTVPVIPDASGSAEYLRQFLPQCVYQGESVDSLAAVLVAVTRARHTEALKAAQKWVKRELDPDRIASAVFDIYESILRGQSTFGTKRRGSKAY